MNCRESRQHWNLYHDSEKDAGLHFRIGEHLAVCPQCAEWFQQQSRLEYMLVENIAVRRPTAELWDRVLAQTQLLKPVPARRWFLFSFSGALACAAGILIAIVLLRHAFPSQPISDLTAITTTFHHRLAGGDEPLQFRSRSDLEVDNYLLWKTWSMQLTN